MALLVEHSPHIAAQFHPTQNEGLSLDTLTHGSAKKIWWLGDCNHEWQAVVSNRTGKNSTGCPYCVGGFVLSGFNDLATTHPGLSLQWDYGKNHPLLPTQVTAGNHNKVHWIGQCRHEWSADLASRALNNRGCPFCAGQKVLSGFNDLATEYPKITQEWHPTKNELSPSEISAKSNRKVWWLGGCGHEWDAVINKRTDSARGCPFCSGNKVLVGFNDLATTHPDIAQELVPDLNGGITGTQISIGYKKMLTWRCRQGHLHKVNPYEKSRYAVGCPICSGRKVLKGFNDLKSLNPALANEWNHTKNKLLPDQISLGSNRKVWWICLIGHEWIAPIVNRTARGDACPLCSNLVSKAEQDIADFIASLGLVVVQSNRKILKGLEIDIYVPEKKVAIEYNGLYWHSELRKSDPNYHQLKWDRARLAGVHLIQIWEDDWKNKPDVIKDMIRHKLGESNLQEKIYARKLRVEKISQQVAHNFFEESTVYIFPTGTCYYGLLDSSGIHAVLSFEKVSLNSAKIQYVMRKNVVGGFSKLVNHVSEEDKIDSLISVSNNCLSSGEMYVKNGFLVDRVEPPGYRYVVFGKKVKLWDAGSTIWKKEISKTNGI